MARLINPPSAYVAVTSVDCACPVRRAAAVEGGEPLAQTAASTLKAGTVYMCVCECERERAPLESNLQR